MIFTEMGNLRRGNMLFLLKWGILEEKMRDFHLNGKFALRKRYFHLNGGFSKRKRVNCGLNGGFAKGKRVIFA